MKTAYHTSLSLEKVPLLNTSGPGDGVLLNFRRTPSHINKVSVSMGRHSLQSTGTEVRYFDFTFS